MVFLILALCCIRKGYIFSAEILTLPKVPKVMIDILKLRLNMLNVDSDSKSTGFLGAILHSLESYSLMPYLHLWQRVSIFLSYSKWNRLLTVESLNMKYFLTASEEKPVVKLTLTACQLLFTCKLLVTWNNRQKSRTQRCLLVNAGLRGSVP